MATETNPSGQEIIVVLQKGIVSEILGLGETTNVTVLNYDIEDAHPDDLKPSPLDGELCIIRKF
jgi:hypothetical protein